MDLSITDDQKELLSEIEMENVLLEEVASIQHILLFS